VMSIAIAAYALGLALLPEFRARVSPLAAQLVRAAPAIAMAHFIGGGIALAVGALQFAQRLRLQQPSMHRWLGRLYVVSVLLSGSMGLVMAARSTGGMIAQVGFGALAVLWLGTTIQGYRAIRARHIELHRAWMARSFSLTLAALTLRIYLPASALAGWPFESAYAAIAWLSWVPNLLIAMQLAPLRERAQATTTR
jgi:uncharacterized membrane protein